MSQFLHLYQQTKTIESYQLSYDTSTDSIIIGNGYNLSKHNYEEIFNDLTGIGFDRYSAQVLAEAAHKTGVDAQEWIASNRFLQLTDQQHQDLFQQVIIPELEEDLSQQILKLHETYPNSFNDTYDSLTDNQKEILFRIMGSDNLNNHPLLTYSVINKDWQTAKNELSKLDSHDSKLILEDLLSETSESSEWNLSEEQEIDLTIPTNYDFTYNQEIGHQGQSLIPHFPGGKSGVTIGPGYDMGHRNPEEIYQDLSAAGIDTEVINILMQAANKTGSEAAEWVASHRDIHITEEQQRILFYDILVPEYESRTQEQLSNFLEKNPEIDPSIADWDNLSDKQRQMLFDFTYNAGLEKFPTFVKSVLNEDWDSVYQSFERYSAGELLSFRNESFYEEFLEENLHFQYTSPDEPADDYQPTIF